LAYHLDRIPFLKNFVLELETQGKGSSNTALPVLIEELERGED